MSKRSKYGAEEKYKILMEYEHKGISITELCRLYEISKDTFSYWKYNYERNGLEGLEESRTWNKYTKELKESAVLEYLSGNCSQDDVVKKYGISRRSVLQQWIKIYNSHRELKDIGKGMSNSMTKERKTSLEQRIEIVKFCIENEHDYKLASETSNVSYQQVYRWVKKFETGEVDALVDKRGHRKEEHELAEEDKIKRKIKEIELENERLRAENAFLKKLQELERRRF